jgi:quercetin dioxygenase-like cupin family protein
VVKRRIALLAILGALAILVMVLSADTSVATAPSGVAANFTVRAPLAPYHFDSNDFKVFQKDRQDVVVRELTLAPGGTTGWHSHPGPSIVIVTQGALSFYEASDPTCTAQTFAAGEGLVEAPGDVHVARNEGTTPVVLVITFLDVPVGGAFRLDAPNPGNCAF